MHLGNGSRNIASAVVAERMTETSKEGETELILGWIKKGPNTTFIKM